MQVLRHKQYFCSDENKHKIIFDNDFFKFKISIPMMNLVISIYLSST